MGWRDRRGFSLCALTIRSSRHRFAASAKPRKIVALPPPQSGAGLTQALAECGQAFKRQNLNLLLHSLESESQERLAGLDQKPFRTLYVN